MNAIDLSLVEVCSPASRLSADEMALVSDWLDAFEADSSRPIVLDKGSRLWTDYDQLGGEQNRVALILLDKLQKGQVLHVRVPAAASSTSQVGAHWGHLDSHRTVLLAVALHANAHVLLANATHLDWHPSRVPSQQPQPAIDNVLLNWLDALVKSLTTLPTAGAYKVPPSRLSGSLAAAIPVGVGKNYRKAWETATHRYEWDYQHGRVEEYSMSGVWLREADPTGTTTSTSYSGTTRVWGR
jgi:hypothetical protein